VAGQEQVGQVEEYLEQAAQAALAKAKELGLLQAQEKE
jgi:hypothetical protein